MFTAQLCRRGLCQGAESLLKVVGRRERKGVFMADLCFSY